MSDKNTDITHKRFICNKCGDDTANDNLCDECQEIRKYTITVYNSTYGIVTEQEFEATPDDVDEKANELYDEILCEFHFEVNPVEDDDE